MGRFRDIKGMGPSKIIPRKVQPYEPPMGRHTRRLNANIEYEVEVRDWCTAHGVGMAITNEGHHWKFFYEGKVAEWWPSSAKLVFQKAYRQGTHCHDYEQLKAALMRRWKLTEKAQVTP